MDIHLIRSKEELEGTCYFEFLPGKYESSRIWSDVSVYLDEESMGLLEPSIEKIKKEYDHFSFIDICKSDWLKILDEFKKIEINIENGNPEYIRRNCAFIFKSTESDFFSQTELNSQKLKILIQDLSDWIKCTLKLDESIAILGI